MHKEKIRLVHESLLKLSENNPTDAYLVNMHLEGLNYQQMAKKYFGSSSFSDEELTKRENAIKKQFTRKNSGSLAKFKKILEVVMKKNNLFREDILQ